MLCFKACLVPLDDLCLVIGTGQEGNYAALDWNQGLGCSIACVATARALDTAGWRVVQETTRLFGGESTGRRELCQMLVTAEKGNREFIEKEKCKRVPRMRVDGRLACLTWERRLTVGKIGLWLVELCWRHLSKLAGCQTGK